MALFIFLLAKAALSYLPTALPVALRPLFPFRQAQYVQVFPLKPAPSCKLFAGLSSTNKSAIFFSYLTLFLFSTRCLFLHLSFYLNLSGRNCLFSSSVLSGYNGSPDTHFSRGRTRLMSWSDGERYLCPLQSLVVSLLLSLVSSVIFSRIQSSLFLDWRRSVSSKFFDTQVPSISTEEFVLPRHARCDLSSLQRTQPTVKLLSL